MILKILLISILLVSVIFADLAEANENKVTIARVSYLKVQQRVVDAFAKPEMNANGHRNFMRYLAKMQQSIASLNNAEANYRYSLRKEYQLNPDYKDLDYVENKDIKEVLAQYDKIKAEVGPETLQEAERAFKYSDLEKI